MERHLISLPNLPALDLSHLAAHRLVGAEEESNTQTRDGFAAEASAIAARQQHLIWRAPSQKRGARRSVPDRGA